MAERRHDKYEFGFEDCAFAYLASKDKPCWGRVHVIDEIGEEYLYGCEGHEDCSMYLGISDEENLRRYDPKPVTT